MEEKNPGGRKPFYNSPEEMQVKIDEYFRLCEGEPLLDKDGTPIRNKYGKIIRDGRKPPTITGLALALGFNSRQALLNYEAKDAFHDTVARAKSRVEQYTEERLFDKDGNAGAKFSLMNNFKGWKEQQDVNMTMGKLEDIL